MTTLPRRALLLAAALLPAAARAQGTPSAVIEGFHATLLEIMKNARALRIRGRDQRRALTRWCY